MGEADPSQPFHLTQEDKNVLDMTDEEYTLLDWEFVRHVIGTGELQRLTRLPSQLRLYQSWSKQIRDVHGSTTNFLLKYRLDWEPLPGSCPEAGLEFECEDPTPFKARSDYKIIPNDWPYGLVPGITHICIWLKNRLPTDDTIGALTPEGKAIVQEFIDREIAPALGIQNEDKLLWFKNHTSIQSIRAVDHVHVLLRGVDHERIAAILEPWPPQP